MQSLKIYFICNKKKKKLVKNCSSIYYYSIRNYIINNFYKVILTNSYLPWISSI